jgi:predicted adenylyl cyclase CyaB
MPKNIEIKARVSDFQRLKELAERLSDVPCQLLIQEDTFFETSTGRLKLRVFDSEHGELIYYARDDSSGAKTSTYLISKTSEPQTLKAILTLALQTRGVVRKRRRLYLVGQTRIHLDEVENLGHFVELEFVMREGQSVDEGQAVIQDLMTRLGIAEADLVAVAYIDLLRGQDLQ